MTAPTRLLIPVFTMLAALGLGACDTVPLEEPPTRAQIADSTLPPMKTFAAPHPQAPVESNANLAADFLALHFQLESGRPLDRFTRFEAPITVRVTGNPPPTLDGDLRRLLTRLRTEAGIDITLTGSPDANITIVAVRRSEIRRALPSAACFVVPNVTSLAEYRRNRRSARTDWGNLTERDRLGIFVPDDASPQETRDCLHEELAQSLGPLNDLYRLKQSIFNDDNVQAVLTGFDMMILRATYSPELHSGMTRDQVAARLPVILNRLNPAGRNLPYRPIQETPRDWIDAIQTALGPGASAAARRRAGNEALRIAIRQGWQDHRLAFSHYIVGRMAQIYDPESAKAQFDAATAILSRLPGTEVQRAYVATQTAAYAIVAGNGEAALRIIRPSLPVAQRAENAALLSTLMLLEAQALDLMGRTDKAHAVRLDSIGWARYGFGSDWAVRAKMNEIAALGPQIGSGGQS